MKLTLLARRVAHFVEGLTPTRCSHKFAFSRSVPGYRTCMKCGKRRPVTRDEAVDFTSKGLIHLPTWLAELEKRDHRPAAPGELVANVVPLPREEDAA